MIALVLFGPGMKKQQAVISTALNQPDLRKRWETA